MCGEALVYAMDVVMKNPFFDGIRKPPYKSITREKGYLKVGWAKALQPLLVYYKIETKLICVQEHIQRHSIDAASTTPITIISALPSHQLRVFHELQ